MLEASTAHLLLQQRGESATEMGVLLAHLDSLWEMTIGTVMIV